LVSNGGAPGDLIGMSTINTASPVPPTGSTLAVGGTIIASSSFQHTGGGGGGGVTESIDELTKEVEQLKQKLEEERAKFNDVELHVVAQKLDPLTNLQIKPRRVLKGHQTKVLCLDWSSDKRHVAS